MLEAARVERDELAVAMRVLAKHGYIDTDAVAPSNTNRHAGLNEQQSQVYECTGYGEIVGLAPKDVVGMLHSKGIDNLSADYVRTTLWRLAQRGLLQSQNGLYWRPGAPDAANVEAPDAKTSEASEVSGPVTGRERGYPPSTPEGSIPSGSTQSRPNPAWDEDLDPDVPF